MKYAYLYVKNIEFENCIKYGLKLSDNINKSITVNNVNKCGFVCYISPKDSELYNNVNYKCIKIDISGNKNIYVIDDTFENFDFYDEFIVNISDYRLGQFENPKILVCTSIIPENVFRYNTLIDSPLPYDNSKDFYYLNNIYHLLEEQNINLKDSLDYLLHCLVDTDNTEYFANDDDSIKIFVDKNDKKYTVCN